MKTQPPSSAPNSADASVDATLVAASPAAMITPGHDSPAGDLYETIERPLDGITALALDRTRVPQPGAQSVPVTPPKFGRFAVLRTLGEGGMGVVYAAYDEELDRRIAIKVLRDAAQDAASRERMVREAQAMARLSHPNVVQVHDVGDHNGQLFVAMEFVKGMTLRTWLSGQDRTWREVRDMFVQAGRGLAAAHAEGLVHRDFKPDNVLIGGDGRARVADFGLAGAAGNSDSALETVPDSVVLRVGRQSAFSTSLTLVGTIMGTPAYMSPEQHRGVATDARSDQFSFCVALWGALYGQPPFAGDNLAELATAVCLGELGGPPPGDVPKFIHAALVRGLAVDPAARHPSMDALLAELTRDLISVRVSRWRGLTIAIGAAALAGLGVFAATRERDPTADELAQIAGLTAEARAAGAEAHWVYPPSADPKDTSILRVVALDRTEGPASRPAQAQANALRGEFADALTVLGDRYWDDDVGRPFARDYYSQALVFQPDHPRARERGLYTPGQMAELLDKAEHGQFTAADLAAAELLEILADADLERRDGRLRAFLREHGAASQAPMVAALLGPDPDTNVPKDMPDPPAADPAPPAPEPPVVIAEPEPEPEPVAPRPRQPKAEPENKPAAPAEPPAVEPEEQLEKAAQDRAQSDALAEEGEAARRRGDFAAAERHFNQALAAYNRNGAALMGLSDVAFDRGNFEKAVVFAERAVKAEGKQSDFRIRLGDAYFKVLRYPDAKTQYERAAELGNPRAAARLGKVKEKIGG